MPRARASYPISSRSFFANLRIDMRPVMKSNPWPRRLQHVPMAGMLILIAVLSTKPITLTGLAIALCTVPFLCLAIVAVSYRWSRRFSGSKFMNIVAIILMITVATAVHSVANYLKPYIGQHFCQVKGLSIDKCLSAKWLCFCCDKVIEAMRGGICDCEGVSDS